MTRAGMRIVPKRGNSLGNFTPYKSYVVLAGTGDANLNIAARFYGTEVHSEKSCNVRDDVGNIRYVTMDFFQELKFEFGGNSSNDSP